MVHVNAILQTLDTNMEDYLGEESFQIYQEASRQRGQTGKRRKKRTEIMREV